MLKKNILPILICLVLMNIIIIGYWPIWQCSFTNFDDAVYVYANNQVINGLSWDSIKWAFSIDYMLRGSINFALWHPTTWLSLMLDSEVFGITPSGFHFTNLLFHILNTILLFLILHRMTKMIWQCAFVAALFAIHPLHVESVAWISERKDVLSTFFWMLTIGAFFIYTEQKKMGMYILALTLFAIGLMAKPTLITLPFILILLDYWPLNRFPSASDDKSEWSTLKTLILEKIPFIALSIVFATIGYLAAHYKVLEPIPLAPLPILIGNIFRSYVVYILKMFWPINLSVLHPIVGIWIWQFVAAPFILTGLTVLILLLKKNRPYIVVGWLWFLVTLVPTIGAIGKTHEAYAERYTYIPLIGIFIMIAWGALLILKHLKFRRVIAWSVAVIIIVILTCFTWIQTSYWRNTETLMSHAISVNKYNYMAHIYLGNDLIENGQTIEGLRHFKEALDIDPNLYWLYNTIASNLIQLNQTAEAEQYLNKSLQVNPGYSDTYYCLGNLLHKEQRLNEAVNAYEKAIQLSPDLTVAYQNLAMVLINQKKLVEAINILQKSIKINPTYAEGYYNLAVVNMYQKRFDTAAEQFQDAIRYKPTLSKAHYYLGVVYNEQKKYDEAIHEFEDTLRYNPDLYQAHYNIGLIDMTQGKYVEAIQHFNDALSYRPDFEAARNNLRKVIVLQHKKP